MPISISMIILSSQLVIAVADEVPKFDIARSCKLDAAAVTGLAVEQPIKNCMNDEQQALQQLGSQWSNSPLQAEQAAVPMKALVVRRAMSVY